LIDSVSLSYFSSDAIDSRSNQGLGEDATVLGDGAPMCLVIDTCGVNDFGEGKDLDVPCIDLGDASILDDAGILGDVDRPGDIGCLQFFFSESIHTIDRFVEAISAEISGTTNVVDLWSTYVYGQMGHSRWICM
jgi:hypothetical protein